MNANLAAAAAPMTPRGPSLAAEGRARGPAAGRWLGHRLVRAGAGRDRSPAIMGTPIGTVMSRIHRARGRLRAVLADLAPKGSTPGYTEPRLPMPRPQRAPVTPRAESGSPHCHLPPCPATGFSRAFLVTAGIMLLALIISLAVIRAKRADLGEGRP